MSKNRQFVGIKRYMDKLSRIVIPKEYCRQLNLGPDTLIEILMTTNDEIIIKKSN